MASTFARLDRGLELAFMVTSVVADPFCGEAKVEDESRWVVIRWGRIGVYILRDPRGLPVPGFPPADQSCSSGLATCWGFAHLEAGANEAQSMDSGVGRR